MDNIQNLLSKCQGQQPNTNANDGLQKEEMKVQNNQKEEQFIDELEQLYSYLFQQDSKVNGMINALTKIISTNIQKSSNSLTYSFQQIKQYQSLKQKLSKIQQKQKIKNNKQVYIHFQNQDYYLFNLIQPIDPQYQDKWTTAKKQIIDYYKKLKQIQKIRKKQIQLHVSSSCMQIKNIYNDLVRQSKRRKQKFRDFQIEIYEMENQLNLMIVREEKQLECSYQKIVENVYKAIEKVNSGSDKKIN